MRFLGAETVIYFIQCPERIAVKIGVATDVDRRLKALQIGCPDKLNLIGTMNGGFTEERELHRKLRGHRIRGEWYHLNSKVWHEISGLIHQGSTYRERPFEFTIGRRVTHPDYGLGKIILLEGNEVNPKGRIEFVNGQSRTFVLSHSPLRAMPATIWLKECFK